jgi:ribosomal protein L32
MSTPKHRVTHSKKLLRNFQWRNKLLVNVEARDICSKCQSIKQLHYICNVCGEYRGQNILQPSLKSDSVKHNSRVNAIKKTREKVYQLTQRSLKQTE